MIMTLTDSDWPLISLLILFPLLGALGCALPFFSARIDPNGKVVKFWSVGVSGVVLFFTVILVNFIGPGFISGNSIGQADQLSLVHEQHVWIPSLGISFSLVLDGLSYVFCALTALVTCAVALWAAPKGISCRAWYGLLLLAESTVMGAFLASDLVLFYMFYEVMLIPVIAAIALWGGVGRLGASYKFALYTLVGSVLMFVAILYIGWSARAHGMVTFELSRLEAAGLFSAKEQILLGAAFLLAFAVKVPCVPLHSWLPDTYREAPHGVAAFVAALLGKVGLYGIIRFVLPLFPALLQSYGEWIAVMGAVGVLYGALAAMHQRDMRLLLAYSSISHLGFCILGVAAGTAAALHGAVFQAVSHGIVTAGLFLLFGHLIDVRQSKNFVDFGGLAHRLPRSAFLLMIFSLAGVALPLTSSFVGEFLILMGSYSTYPLCTAVAISGVVLGAVYTLTAYLRVMFGADRCTDVTPAHDVSFGAATVAVALGIVVLALGIYPKSVLTLIEGSVVAASPPTQQNERDAGASVAAIQSDLQDSQPVMLGGTPDPSQQSPVASKGV